MIDFVQDINEQYAKIVLEKQMSSTKEARILNLFSIPIEIDDSSILDIGGCSKMNTFFKNNTPPTNSSVYRYEKELEYNSLAMVTASKYYDVITMKKSKEEIDVMNQFFTNQCCLGPQYFVINKSIYGCMGFVDSYNKEDGTISLMLFDVESYSKNLYASFKELIVCKYLPAVIALFKSYDFIRMIKIIVKHPHNKSEKLITLEKGIFEDREVVIVDGEPTQMVLDDFWERIKSKLDALDKHYEDNTIATSVNTRHCKDCIWKDLCDTL